MRMIMRVPSKIMIFNQMSTNKHDFVLNQLGGIWTREQMETGRKKTPNNTLG